jgi:hypothetical protein
MISGCGATSGRVSGLSSRSASVMENCERRQE